MDENLNKPEELDNTPSADEARDIVAQAEAKTPAEATAAFPAEPAKPKSKKPLVALLAILFLIIIGVCAYFLFFQSKPANNQNSQASTGANADQTDEQPTEQEIEFNPTEEKTETNQETSTEISEDDLSPLFKKLLLLHMPMLKNYLSYATRYDTYETDKYFTFSGSYEVSEHFYPDASELTAGDKFFIVTQYMADKDYFKPLSDFNVPSDFFASKNPTLCDGKSGFPCGNENGSAVSEDEVAKVYREFFGEIPTSFERPTYICGSRDYDSTYHIFHTFPYGGCGGVDFLSHQAYIEKYTTTGDTAYIYLRIASIYYDYSPNATNTVYKAFLKHADFYDSETQTNLTPDESLVYSHTNDDKRIITADNYTEFEQYRFVFGKDGDNYYFKTVEKL